MRNEFLVMSGKPRKSSGSIGNIREDVLKRCRREYFDSGMVMTEYLMNYGKDLTVDEKKWLLDWGGENTLFKVNKKGEIVKKKF